jgi:hypothetical protein
MLEEISADLANDKSFVESQEKTIAEQFKTYKSYVQRDQVL